MKVLRPGVSRVREELEALLGVPVAEVAGPAGRRGRSVPVAGIAGPEPGPAEVGDAVRDAGAVVGTEAVLHRVRHASAVVFLDFDQHLLAPRLGAGEESLALLARASRLVGARGRKGAAAVGPRGDRPVLVQTRVPDHDVLAAVVHGDPDRLTATELALRTELRLPPASALALASGPQAPAFVAGLRERQDLALDFVELERGSWLVRADDHGALCDALAAVPRPAGRLRVEVDPVDV
jgi:primosomal protein N' (replication factor Y)